jgi:hypothetical protein
LLHYTNGTWSHVLPPGSSTLNTYYGVHFTSSTQGWVVGDDEFTDREILLNYSSGSWNKLTRSYTGSSLAFYDVHFTSSGEGWAVGENWSTAIGAIIHYSYGTWRDITPPYEGTSWWLNGVHFSSASDGWAVGWDDSKDAGVLLHYTCSGGNILPIYRFWSAQYGHHFYTISEGDRDYIMTTWPDIWEYEGPVFYASSTEACGSLPVYRFWSETFLGHFYTISEEEKNLVQATMQIDWKYEGPVYYAYPTQVTGTLPMYRFWSEVYLGHFYTISEADKNYVIATWPDIWQYEGPVFYAYPL